MDIQSQQKEWNLVVLTIVCLLDYEEGILSYLCRDGLSIEISAICFFSVDKFIKFSTHNQLTQSQKKRLIKKFDIKKLVIIFIKGGKHKIIRQTIS